MQAVKKAGLKKFDAWAHNPYATRRATRRRRSRTHRGAVTLGNLDVLTKELTEALGQEAALAHRVRLPDEPAGQDVRRLVLEAGALPQAGVRDRAQEPERRHDAVVPAQGRADARGLAVGLMTTRGKKKPAYTRSCVCRTNRAKCCCTSRGKNRAVRGWLFARAIGGAAEPRLRERQVGMPPGLAGQQRRERGGADHERRHGPVGGPLAG